VSNKPNTGWWGQKRVPEEGRIGPLVVVAFPVVVVVVVVVALISETGKKSLYLRRKTILGWKNGVLPSKKKKKKMLPRFCKADIHP